MSGSSRSPDDGDSSRTARTTPPAGTPASRAPRSGRRQPEHRSKPVLRLRIVENDDGPDRGTVHPPGLTGIERMETWLSVNAAVVVDRSAWR